jgi:two-component system NarL family sensor kinase
MVGVVHQTEQARQGWATFAPGEFAGQRSGRSARQILPAITEINDLLLSRGDRQGLFIAIAQVCARALDYPYVSINLFDDDLQRAEVAGSNDPSIHLLTARRSPHTAYRPPFLLSELRDMAWVRAMRDGMVYVTASPQEVLMPFAPAARARAVVRRLGIVQGIVLPLMSGGRLVGALKIGSRRRDYEPGECNDLLTLVHHVALAVEMWRLRDHAEATRQAAVHKALAESARMIARAETSSVIRAIVEAGSRLFMDSRFALLLPDASGDLICVAAHGPNTEGVLGFWVHKGQGLAGRVFETARPVLTGDVQAEAGSARKDIDDLANFHSYMAVPLMADSGPIGVIVAGHDERDLYSESDLHLLGTLADHATIALEKHRLLQEAKRQAAEQAALAESANAIARLDVGTVLETIVTQASNIVKLSRCSVILHNPADNTLRWAAGTEVHPQVKAEIYPPDAGLIGHVFSTGEPLLVDDILADARAIAKHLTTVTGTRSFLCVPLRWGQSTIGVLIATHQEVGIYTRHDLGLLATFADYATIALSNARLYGSLQQREEERAFLLRQLMTGQEAERRRVAVDIHDGPLQSIGVNILAVDRIRKLMDLGRAPEAMSELVQVRERMSAVIQELRDVINDLRPVALENLGLMPATSAHLNYFHEQTGIRTHLEDNLDGYRLPAAVEVIFFRLLQEALTNVRKHASAASVWVTFELAEGVFRMSVTDNGLGFDPKSILRSPESGHIGLHSMQERIEAIGGGMEVVSAQGQGTRITFWATR